MKKSNRSISSARTMFFNNASPVSLAFFLLLSLPADSSPLVLSSIHFDLRFAPGLETEAAMVLAESERAYTQALSLLTLPPDRPLVMSLGFSTGGVLPLSSRSNLQFIWKGNWYAVKYLIYRGIYRHFVRDRIRTNPEMLPVIDALAMHDASMSWAIEGGVLDRDRAAARLRGEEKVYPDGFLKLNQAGEGPIPDILRDDFFSSGNGNVHYSVKGEPGNISILIRDKAGVTGEVASLPFDLVRDLFFDFTTKEVCFWGQRGSLKGLFRYSLIDRRLTRFANAPDFRGPVTHDREGSFGTVPADGGYRFVRYDRRQNETRDILMTSYLPLHISADGEGNCLFVVPRNNTMRTYEYLAEGRLREITGLPAGTIPLFWAEKGILDAYSLSRKIRLRIADTTLHFHDDASLVNSEPVRDTQWLFIRRSLPR